MINSHFGCRVVNQICRIYKLIEHKLLVLLICVFSYDANPMGEGFNLCIWIVRTNECLQAFNFASPGHPKAERPTNHRAWINKIKIKQPRFTKSGTRKLNRTWTTKCPGARNRDRFLLQP